MTDQRLKEALTTLGYSPEIFHRTIRRRSGVGKPEFARTPETVKARALVWLHMRQPRAGVQLSLPEIAAATGTKHTTVITALRRLEKQ